MGPRLLRSAFCPVIRLALPLTASCLVAPSAHAEDAAGPVLSVTGGVRNRGELLSGQYRPGLPAHDQLVSVRTDLAARLDLGAVMLVGEVIDARGYAQNPIKGDLLRQAQGVLDSGDTRYIYTDLSYSF